jgi:hypothetical protein
MNFKVPAELTRVRTERSLTDDRAILLEFDYVSHDSTDSPGELAVLYDFERGDLRSYRTASAW